MVWRRECGASETHSHLLGPVSMGRKEEALLEKGRAGSHDLERRLVSTAAGIRGEQS